MCTLILMRGMFSGFPLVVVSNRDEDPRRPSADPARWEDRPSVFAPRDLVCGGTWIGTARQGVFAGMTNRDRVPHRPHGASRGHLVSDALAEPTARAARDRVCRAFASASYNGFHLAIVDAEDAFLLIGDGGRLVCEPLPFGVTVLTAYGTTPAHVPRAREIERRIATWQERDRIPLSALDHLLNFHADGDPRAAACVHDLRESHRTISSMVLRVDREWSVFESWFRRGPACAGPLGNYARNVISLERSES